MTEKRSPAAFGRRVKELREARGLSQQALAMAAGLSISVVAQLEQGLRADPRLSTAVALASALGVSMDELLRESGGGPRVVPPVVNEGPPAKRRKKPSG